MLDLKPYYDAVLAADAEVKRVAIEIDALFQGTDEDKAKALAMRPALDEAQTKYDNANALYVSLKKASAGSDLAKKFVPVSTTPTETDGQPEGSMKRADFTALDAKAQMQYMLRGGKIEG